jgi:large subunit ribosomal protein L25
MSDTTLVLEPRTLGKKKTVKAVRAGGKIPGILYGHGYVDPVPFQVDAPSLREALSGDAGRHAVLRVAIAGRAGDVHAVLKDYQLDPVRDRLVHLDLLAISMSEPIIATVSVRLAGEAQGVREGGVLDQGVYEAQVEALPANLPNELVVDVSELVAGRSLRLGDITLPAGVTLQSDPDTVVAAVMQPSTMEQIEAEQAIGEPVPEQIEPEAPEPA